MPTAMTFTSLQDDLRSYLERGYSVDTQVYAQLPKLINMAERSIARALKIQGFVVPAVSTLDAGVSVYAKPDRWRDTVSMQIGTGLSQNSRKFLFPRSLEYCRSYWPDSAQEELPLFYADYDYQHWLIAPTPDIDYPWEVIYYELPALLDTTNQTNYLTQYAPNALLYRALLEASPYLKNDERIATWQNLYGGELENLNKEDLQKVVDRASVRNED